MDNENNSLKVLSLLEQLNNNFNKLETKINNIDTDVKNMKNMSSKVESRIRDLELVLENETNKNIHILAEGHTDIIHKIKELSELLTNMDTKIDILDVVCKMNVQKINKLTLSEHP